MSCDDQAIGLLLITYGSLLIASLFVLIEGDRITNEDFQLEEDFLVHNLLVGTASIERWMEPCMASSRNL